jgi:Fur family transcriptional regulator, ferric uptake regulator
VADHDGDEVLAQQATSLLRSVAVRVTKPRVALLARILDADGAHLSADALHEQVADVEPTIHRATVYRTLEGLTSAGVLRHVHLDRGLTAYHLVDDPQPSSVPHQPGEHLHAQCSECGEVTDLPADILGDTAIRIRRASGFQLDASHVALSGRCRSCAASAAH